MKSAMSDLIAVLGILCLLIFAIAVTAAYLAWLLVLPTIGLLYVTGYLP